MEHVDQFVFTGALTRERKGYSSLCLELDVASQGDSLQEAKDALLQAVSLYLETAFENNLPYLRPVPPEHNLLVLGRHLQIKKGNLLVTIPIHPKDLHTGTLASILRQARLNPEELRQLL